MVGKNQVSPKYFALWKIYQDLLRRQVLKSVPYETKGPSEPA